MLIAIAIAEEMQELQWLHWSSASFEVLSFLWIWQEVWVWAGVNLLGFSAPHEPIFSPGFHVACMPIITRSQFEILKPEREHHWKSPQIKPVQLKLLAKGKEPPEAQNLQNFDAILCNPCISSAMAMAMSINRTLCVLVTRGTSLKLQQAAWEV